MNTFVNILRVVWLSGAVAFVLAGAHATTAAHAPSAAMKSPARAADKVDTPGGGAVFTAQDSEGAEDVAASAEASYASAVLERLKAAYRHLDGVTVAVGVTPQDQEAVAYYTEGEIVISHDHTVSIDKILAHEIWHVIDWRDNGRLDWGEDLPPSNASDYAIN